MADAADAADDLQKKFDRLGAQIKRLVDVIIAGADANVLNLKLKELEAEQKRVRHELDAQEPGQPLLHPNLAMIYRAEVERLSEALRDPEDGREAFELVRSLIKEVGIVPAADTLVLELKGDLAGILAMSHGGKPADGSEAEALKIKMVAGTGFGQARTIGELRKSV